MIDHEDDKRWDSPWPDETERAMAEDIALQCGEIYDPDIETIDRRNRR